MDLPILKNKKIIVGITGSIATYKTPQMIREFIKAGAEVRVVATKSAAEFVSFQVLENLTLNPLIFDMFDSRMNGKGAWHVELAHWCDVMLIAPCSATTLSKLATGNCDNALSCVAIALPKNKPLIVAPAMDFTMYEHSATQRNIKMLINDGVNIIYPESGELASGLTGVGRLPNFDTIINATIQVFQNPIRNNYEQILSKNTASGLDDVIAKDKWNAELALDLMKNGKLNWLKGKKILISAGPTQEKIDDVRFLSNYSTGKMGYALAEIASKNGAEVTLVSGPTNIPIPTVSHFISVTSANDMFDVCVKNFNNCDIAIMSAAVADFTPEITFNGKIKKQDIDDNYSLKLIKTKDILAELGKHKTHQMLIGFALESENEVENGKQKIISKNCDIIIVNSANKQDSGFGGDNNTITIITKNGNIKTLPPMKKIECAVEIYSSVEL